jgi:glycosyltransferase involved in cell wall biosynthesis
MAMETPSSAPKNAAYAGTAAPGRPAEPRSAASPRQRASGPAPFVSVIVPARNEEACLRICLESLIAQTGISFEIIVVDDHSTDRTHEIAASFPSVRVLEADPLPDAWTGKNNAVTTGARHAKGQWLLFTDADTVHLPGSLAAAVKEAEENGAELLSYSPEQIAVTFWERATLPVVFAELARQYPPSQVSDPASPLAAANGQYILIRRETYDGVGGHAAIAHDILEDVALACAVKSSGRKIRFRYAPAVVRTRMYRNYRQLRDGWTKNLTLLFPNPGWLAVKTLAWWGLGWGLLVVPFVTLLGDVPIEHTPSLASPHNLLFSLLLSFERAPKYWWFVLLILTIGRNFARLRRANFDWAMEWLGALFGMPMFAYLLLRSKRAHSNSSVPWKGRTYGAAHRTGSEPKTKDQPFQPGCNRMMDVLTDPAATTTGRLS